jgi:hypothetical protein
MGVYLSIKGKLVCFGIAHGQTARINVTNVAAQSDSGLPIDHRRVAPSFLSGGRNARGSVTRFHTRSRREADTTHQ